MKRYIKLYPYFVSRSIKARLAYRFDALIGIFGFLIENTLVFTTLYLTVSSVSSLEGWTVDMIGFLYGFYLLPKGIDHVFSDQIWQLSNGGITRGLLDKYLIRPLNPLFQLVAEMVQLEGLGEVILGIAFLVVFTPNLSVIWTFEKVLSLVVAGFFGIFFFFSIKLIFASISFWTKRSIEIMTTVYDLSNFSKYPIGIFNKFIRVMMTFILPFSVVIFFPVEAVLLDKNVWLPCLYVFIASFIFVCISLFVWHKGLSRYESSGS